MPSENPSFFVTYIVPILLGFLGSLPGLGTFLAIVLKVKRDNLKTEADTLAVYESVARNAAQNVITKDNRIERLEQEFDRMRERVHALEDERDQQQDTISQLIMDRERLEKDKASQANEMALLKARVLKLENTLRENKIPIPNGDDAPKG